MDIPVYGRKLVLKKATNLRNANLELIRNNVFINPDLTRQQREEQYKLRQELKRRRAGGEEVIIRKGLIVSKN